MAIDTGAYFENVVATFVIVVTFIIIILAFLYMIYGREEAKSSTTTRA